ncbi:UDP-N-acetylglucosamine--N-acetylmuramyl-(pentapeptide) pyrophosphoryl-UDP N-acetylglucosamine transferase [Thermosipho melanesiensis]|uniref:UDP-N-acetylglucosamine--N-acetylmuramyl-(pentapeptide) pyrophosphoryl-undecaprenol N-acetylglucosamine transferase n=2 Tax=Thermosipho melanesiensis TaxID=46541 RepID=MURG_THEM4|nr:UDP-N-acetylglucosamine--N-acetylmuramyl-(pentapeptide) pyrophosphoryl-undecaprenol N-acetylglucosamine transferase [Thermosipho melanesiensis]A6LLF1.1 RecName: Full=UDP-N-acetylglucosamine--N-acetylmuramyl-(pentapeptide) pyrophosphoryl-undecaprenol N-acetylglucosamine transferase; AltName: Full=Undecaprenyl-PP-MurNAc-pentapeptide-UDPGlcNAc GlcNAc transferase [Thermosipho melanesiensis BI429]ABR30752.1 Undecaprenyldiphospho-muramoylpentapeptide beta-N-acetylglucosaminyltransferase [Thermosipho
MIKIAVAGGVTGGHLYPALATLNELQKITPIDVLYFTVKGKLEEKVLKDYNFKTVSLDVKGLIRPLYSFGNIKRILKILNAKNIVKKALKDFKPDIAFVTGGYVSYPVGVTAKQLGFLLYIHEQNVIPGLTNLKLSKIADKVFVSFESSKKYFEREVFVSGNPIFIHQKKLLNFDKKTVLIIGGSGGSEFLNELACKLAKKMKDLQFILSTGGKNIKCLEENLRAIDYIENMADYYQSVNCAITRGGATTVSELLYFQVPSIVIPWEGATESHQIENAKEIEKGNLGFVVREKDLDLNNLIDKIKILSSRERKIIKKENPATIIAKEIAKEVLK